MSTDGTSTHGESRTVAELARRKAQIREILEITGTSNAAEAIRRIREAVTAAEQVPTLQQRLADAESKVTGDDSTSKELAQTRAELRQVKHRQAFDQAAVAAGVKPEAVGDLYRLSGLQPPDEGDASPESFAEFLGQAKDSRTWAFGGSSPAGQSGSPRPAGQTGSTQGTAAAPPPGAGRSASGSVGQVSYTLSEVAKPGWQQRRPDLVEALKTGAAVQVGE
jgi:hypothetical protein